MTATLPAVALSLRQPWADAVIRGGKRIENRIAWTNSRFRGALLLHAAKGMTRAEYKDALAFARRNGITEKDWLPPSPRDIARGGIVGVCKVIGVVYATTPTVWIGPETRTPISRPLIEAERRWWMGSFALVLDEVRPLPFVECTGALSFFKVPAKIVDELKRLDQLPRQPTLF